MIVSAWQSGAAIQVNRKLSDDQIDSRLVWPDDPDWLAAVAACANYAAPADPSVPDIATARRQAYAAVNAVRGEVRTRWLTDIPGQQLVYADKERAAREWVAARAAATTPADEPALTDFPAIAAEVGLTGESADQVAQVYLNAAALWRQVSATIEGVAMGAFVAIDAAPTPEAALAAGTEFPAALMTALAQRGVII